MNKTKSFEIPKQWIVEGFRRVRSRKGSPGYDGQSVAEFEGDLRNNLYKLWNRMSSGSYMAPPVLSVKIPKSDGGERPLGIPTVADRVAQMIVKQALEPELERHFHVDSYGYRPNKSALDAVAITRQRCWRYPWVIDLDIKGFFDNIDHELLMKAVRHHTQKRWVCLYIERWLKADLILEDGTRIPRERGTPQGGVISPLLANLFLHYVFDFWLSRNWSGVPFARYADDAVCHCQTEAQAQQLLGELEKRFGACGLQLHPQKTRIVYCKGSGYTGDYLETSFDFLGYTFRPRPTRTRQGTLFIGFNPAVSRKALKAMNAKIRGWKLHRRIQATLESLAANINPVIRGWIAYYSRFNRAELHVVFAVVERRLVRWACWKYKRMRRSPRRAWEFLRRIRQRNPSLFAHWQALYSGMNGIVDPGVKTTSHPI